MDEGYQLNVVTLPKSVKPERMRDNVEFLTVKNASPQNSEKRIQ